MNKNFLKDLQESLKTRLEVFFPQKDVPLPDTITDASKFISESERLKKYADIVKHKVISSTTDIDPNVHIVPELLPWCREQGSVVVLDDGTILTSNPGSRVIQNCKALMLHEGIRPERVLPATSEFIETLLAGIEILKSPYEMAKEAISAQQQRLRLLVKEALQSDITDIHIEVRTDIAKIRFRKHGELYLYAEWLPKIAREVVSVCFNKETDYAVTHFNPLVPQNASMPLFIEGRNIRLRLASMPAYGGFDVVLRILTTAATEERIQTLEQLGYTVEQAKLIKKAVQMPHGAIIISGPTGSGKTTTLASCLNLFAPDRKLYTIEDPVEKVIEKATQVPVNEDQEDRSFASLGRATLRMDPDVIVLGEMRDLDTAAVMVRASMTGHLVFSTLHTNTAPGIVTRLVDMGIDPALLSDSNLLICLVCQRLVPILCNNCAMPVTKSPEHKPHLARLTEILGDLTNIRARGRFCPVCQGMGISGRTVVAEVVWVDDQGRIFVRNNDVLGWEKYLQERGWQPYPIHAMQLVRTGVCDPLDIEKVIGSLDVAFRLHSFDYRSL